MPIDVAVLANELDQLFRQKHATQDVERLLTRALATARAEEREANCRAVCALCRGVEPTIHATPTHDPNDADGWQWWHTAVRGPSLPCRAAAIRAGEGA